MSVSCAPIVVGLVAAALALALPAAPAGAPARVAFLVAAGDIASCSSRGDEATARLVARLPGVVAALGDLVYDSGTDAEFRRCYAPSWGRFRARTRPALGNHDYGVPGAAGYFRYFGARAGPVRGYYSYELGSWHVVVLNSNCGPAGGCGAGSPQERWLRADLARSRARCTLAYAHHSRFSSGLHGGDGTLRDLWSALYDDRADVVLGAHDHHYERFAPLTPDGRIDSRRGVRQFVVGTGGRSHYPVLRPSPASETYDTRTYGVLSLRLAPGRYSWRFVPASGATYRDAGAAACH